MRNSLDVIRGPSYRHFCTCFWVLTVRFQVGFKFSRTYTCFCSVTSIFLSVFVKLDAFLHKLRWIFFYLIAFSDFGQSTFFFEVYIKTVLTASIFPKHSYHELSAGPKIIPRNNTYPPGPGKKFSFSVKKSLTVLEMNAFYMGSNPAITTFTDPVAPSS